MGTVRTQALADLLRRHRRSVGLTQEELAARTGLGVRSIGDLERGVSLRPHWDTVALLAEALQLTPEDRTAFEAAARRRDESTSASEELPVALLRHNLPLPLTPLIGREHEEAAVAHLLLRSDVRLLTLVGSPGIGKTRLALQVATGLGDEFPDGVVFVPLAPIREPDLIYSALAQALGLRDAGSQALYETLAAYLHGKRLLLVLDNFEQVVAAAPLVVDLLATSPDLKILVTSRAALHVRGEQEFDVPPLALPDAARCLCADDLSQYAAVALFVQRARAVKPTFFSLTPTLTATVVAICRRLDGIPLALELAAAWIKLLPPSELLRRLEHSLRVLVGGAQDLPERQRTLRGAIAWSYELLSEAEQRLFRRLSVFVGGWTLDFAEEVCQGCDGDSAATLDLLASLTSKSLVVQLEPTANGEARFGLLETLREYGLECLEAGGEGEACRRRHALFLAQLAERGLPGEEDRVVLDRIAEELANIRSALAWARDQGEAELGLRLMGVLWWFWYARGPLDEGIAWLESLVALDRRETCAGCPPVAALVRARGLHGLALLKARKGDYTRAIVLFEDCLALWRQEGDTEGIATALCGLANTALEQNDFDRAQALYEESLAFFRTLATPVRITMPLSGLAWIAVERGDYTRAEELFTEILVWHQAAHATYGIAEVLKDLGEIYLRQGAFARAAALFDESAQRYRDLGAKRGVAIALQLQAQIAYRSSALDSAKALLEEGLLLYREQGVKWGIAHVLSALGDVACAQGDYPRAARLYQESLALNAAMGRRVDALQGLEGLARVAHLQGRLEDAVRLWSAAQTQREALGTPLWPIDSPVYEADVAALRTALGEEVFAAEWEAGSMLSPEQTLAELDE